MFEETQSNKHRSKADDYELLNEFKQNSNADAAGELFKRYAHLVFGVSLKYLKNREDARDMVQKVFEKLMFKLKEHEIHNFSSWLHSLTRNECLMQIRSQKGKYESLLHSDDLHLYTHIPDNDVSESIQLEQQLHALEGAIVQLEWNQQQCIKMFYLEKLSYKQIGEKCNLTFNEVKSYIQNGKRMLRVLLNQTNE